VPFSYDKQQRAFIDAVTTVIRNDEALGPRRDGASEQLWRKMVKLDLPALLVPAAQDGLGLTAVDMACVVEAAGRSLTATPLAMTAGAFTTVLAGAAARSGAAADILGRVMEGTTGTVALTATCPAGTASATIVGRALTAATTIIPDADADLIAVPAVRADGGQHVLVVCAPQQLDVVPAPGIGRGRPVGTLSLDSHPIRDGWVIEHDPRPALITVLTAASAELVGLAAELVSRTVDHARERIQFNEPIGHFQAVKHKLVDAHVAVERARSLTMYAAVAATEPREDAVRAAHRAKGAASEAATLAARTAVQLHGASGLTVSNPISGLYLRARERSILLGAPDVHYGCACLND
jgi:alkylation response protein AidB-like acyl-CoA dehydrogenase